MANDTKLLEKYDTLITTKVRDKDRIIKVSQHIDFIREKLAKKIKGTDSAEIIRKKKNENTDPLIPSF